jgi:hypothetical protein
MEAFQIQATASTIRAMRAASREPIDLLRVVSAMPGELSSITISAVADEIEVCFRFPLKAAGWARQLVSSYEIPSLFAFGVIRFTDGKQIKTLDPNQFDSLLGASTTVSVGSEGPCSEESISVRLGAGVCCTELLTPKGIETFLLAHSWIGCPRSPSVVAAELKVLANQRSLRTRQYSVEAELSQHRFVVDGRNLHITCQLGVSGIVGEIRHTKLGVVGSIRDCARIPEGISADLLFHLDPGPRCAFEDRADLEFRLAKRTLTTVLESVLQSVAAERLMLRASVRKEQEQLAALENRRTALRRADVVCLGDRVIHRVPRNEMDVVCLFSKLSAMNAAPFACEVLEYTAKRGIDALGSFRLTETVVQEENVPIEFEFLFESFLDHGHPVGQTKLIVCWEVSEPDVPELQATDLNWLMRYNCRPIPIPVVVVSRFPNIKIRGANNA